MFNLCLLTLSLLVLAAQPGFAGVYKWVDKEGRTHYSDKPPQAGAVKELAVEPVAAGAVAEEARRRIEELEDYNRRIQRSLDREADARRQAKQQKAQDDAQRERMCQRLRGELAILEMP
jgi:hypothetical protein